MFRITADSAIAPALAAGNFAAGGWPSPWPPGLAFRYSPAPLAGRSPAAQRCVDFGPRGHLILRCGDHDVAEDAEQIVILAGVAWGPGGSSLSAAELCGGRRVTPQACDLPAIRGNALVLCFSKREPRVLAGATLLAAPALYYRAEPEGILTGAESLRMVVDGIARPEVNPQAVPIYFLYRAVAGADTLVRGVSRLEPGAVLTWAEGRVSIRRERDLRSLLPAAPRRDLAECAGLVSEAGRRAASACLAEAGRRGRPWATLLSGGVDSTLMQMWVAAHSAPAGGHRSVSYAVAAPEFDFEVEYAREASALFGTRHTMVPVTAEAFSDLLVRCVDVLGQPPFDETLPCHLAIAAHAGDQGAAGYFGGGLGADTLFGMSGTRALARAERLGRIPLAGPLLGAAARGFAPIAAGAAHLAAEVRDVMAGLADPEGFAHPVNASDLKTDLALMQRGFPAAALAGAAAARRALETSYLGSPHLVERVHALDLLCGVMDTAAQLAQVYAAHASQIRFPYLDEAVIETAFTCDRRIRYFRRRRTKPILRHALAAGSASQAGSRRKGFSGFRPALMAWMRSGPLRPLVREIRRPGFVDRADFERKLADPDWFTWNLLGFHLFETRVLQRGAAAGQWEHR